MMQMPEQLRRFLHAMRHIDRGGTPLTKTGCKSQASRDLQKYACFETTASLGVVGAEIPSWGQAKADDFESSPRKFETLLDGSAAQSGA